MNTKFLFRESAKKLLADFNISAQINHQGLTGSFREDALKDFLASGRLPQKYGIGSGEIVGSTSEISRESDLIIYDKLNCPILLFSDSVQVVPSEGVYGIIEVKSRLSKGKLIEGLENIAAFKKIVPNNNTMQYISRPFGIVFAYSLANNSLESLEKNLREFEENTEPDLWPNMIVVLTEGIIWHTNEQLITKIKSEELYGCNTIRLHFKQDSLFEFYCALMELLSDARLGKISLNNYKELPKKVGNHYVTGHDRFVNKDRMTVSALNEKIISRIFNDCQSYEKITLREILMKDLGQIPEGLIQTDLEERLYYYNPESLPGFHEVENPIFEDEKGYYQITQRLSVPTITITIDGEPYVFSQAYVTSEDLNVIPGMSVDDL